MLSWSAVSRAFIGKQVTVSASASAIVMLANELEEYATACWQLLSSRHPLKQVSIVTEEPYEAPARFISTLEPPHVNRHDRLVSEVGVQA